MQTPEPAAQHSTIAAAAAAGDTPADGTASKGDSKAAAAAASSAHNDDKRPWQGVPRMLRQAAQLLNDPVLMAFGQLPAVVNSYRKEHNSDSADRHISSAATAGTSTAVISSLGLQGRWSGLAAAAAAAAGGADDSNAGGTSAPVVAGLPDNVHLLTLMRAEEGDPTRLIVRLAHNYQVGMVIKILVLAAHGLVG
jgi:hypothetical protein